MGGDTHLTDLPPGDGICFPSNGLAGPELGKPSAGSCLPETRTEGDIPGISFAHYTDPVYKVV